MASAANQAPAKASLFYDPKVRGIFFQAILVLVIGFLFYEAITNAVSNLRAAGIASGFGFLTNPAGFDINQQLIPYSSSGSTYREAFVVGLLNTLLVAVIGIFFATILGFIVGIARLSTNWIVAKVSMVYVEIVRNLPLLLQLFFWYNAVLAPLPSPRQSINFGAGFYLNNRGLSLPKPILNDTAWLIPFAFLAGIVLTLLFRAWARRVQEATGRQYPVGLVGLGAILGLPIVIWLVLAAIGGTNPITFDIPEQQRFNLRGGMQVFPEFVALLLGLVTYTAGFIAEVVRAGILAVSRGQTEASYALGLKPSHTLRLVIVPQAMRVIIPPLTSQYLNLTKNSSLAVAIGYPDLVQVFMGTVLNQTGQAVEVVAITMAVYLTISLITSAIMNIYNRRVAIVER
ncbi:amino acid ABC transporter permease [Salinarimonas soli]|uniref:Amino acid ABC transporter permease n=1 Tax=Salinarimonas soli TaxID=1638099 RepID=A0A5B2W0M2_9HYPH|nr:amino acid ABC transporter permease [Salinarimonas soli]KAA2244016.1 amino acid ABC transporter permease [Salinarimonas soli]